MRNDVAPDDVLNSFYSLSFNLVHNFTFRVNEIANSIFKQLKVINNLVKMYSQMLK